MDRTKIRFGEETAADTLSDKPDKNAKKIEKAAEKMFKNYPPKKK